MNVARFQQRKRYSTPWLYRRTSILGLSRYRVIKYSIMIAAFAVFFAVSILKETIDATPTILMRAASVTVVDGDTIRSNGQLYRLVGFDTPESGPHASCGRERTLADTATDRLRQIVANGQAVLERVPCSCLPGTEGTRECNYGRFCATLRANGRDVGDILVSEGLARPYVCGRSGCPRRQSWCS